MNRRRSACNKRRTGARGPHPYTLQPRLICVDGRVLRVMAKVYRPPPKAEGPDPVGFKAGLSECFTWDESRQRQGMRYRRSVVLPAN